mmetsp:Transcript_79349/g.220756  ORF Transcript_79349/g.220756 Transcript_79349/m.220756 type:complete len:490 (-) Transcript_79349:66-1535(-)
MAAELQCAYAELGVAFGATAAEARRAFLGIARRCHPDKCGAPGSAARFRRAKAALDVLLGPAGARLLASADSGYLSDSDASDSWTPPPPKPSAPAAPEEPAEAAEPAEPEPILDLRGLLEVVMTTCDEIARTARFRQKFLQAGISWPWNCGASGLRGELIRVLRDELDRRVAAMEFDHLSKPDLVWWLEGHGCSLQFALEDDSVSPEMLQRLARRHFADGGVVEATPLPSLGPVASTTSAVVPTERERPRTPPAEKCAKEKPPDPSAPASPAVALTKRERPSRLLPEKGAKVMRSEQSATAPKEAAVAPTKQERPKGPRPEKRAKAMPSESSAGTPTPAAAARVRREHSQSSHPGKCAGSAPHESTAASASAAAARTKRECPRGSRSCKRDKTELEAAAPAPPAAAPPTRSCSQASRPGEPAPTQPEASATLAAATAEDYARWLRQAAQRGTGKEAAEFLLQMAQAGRTFRGRRLELVPLREVVANLGG